MLAHSATYKCVRGRPHGSTSVAPIARFLRDRAGFGLREDIQLEGRDYQ